MSNVWFVMMVILQLSGGLLFVIGQLCDKDLKPYRQLGYLFDNAAESDANDVAKEIAIDNAYAFYKTKYMNIVAGVFLAGGYFLSFFANYTWNYKIVMAVMSVLIAFIVVMLTNMRIRILAKKSAEEKYQSEQEIAVIS